MNKFTYIIRAAYTAADPHCLTQGAEGGARDIKETLTVHDLPCSSCLLEQKMQVCKKAPLSRRPPARYSIMLAPSHEAVKPTTGVFRLPLHRLLELRSV